MADTATLAILTLLFLLAAVYAHLHAGHVATRGRQLWALRIMLVVVGLAFGAVTASVYLADVEPDWLVFLAGFGVVHVPAAIIILLKRQRRKEGATPQGGGRRPDD